MIEIWIYVENISKNGTGILRGKNFWDKHRTLKCIQNLPVRQSVKGKYNFPIRKPKSSIKVNMLSEHKSC